MNFIQESLDQLIKGKNLSSEKAQKLMEEVMTGKATDAQIGALLVALRLKGESVEEVSSFAKVMRDKALKVTLPEGLEVIDTCGTGGDGLTSFNISTLSALVAAGAGVNVAKHGNRSVSSSCGSADVLEALGVTIQLKPEEVALCIQEAGIGFIFAPAFHKAMKYAIGPRRQIGLRTVFNLLGPLTNPAFVKGQVLGVYDPDLLIFMAQTLDKLGVKRALVVHGEDGLDEFSLCSPTKVAELKEGDIRTYTLTPEEVGLKRSSHEEMYCSGVEEACQIFYSVLNGEEQGAKKDIVLLNAGAALWVAAKVDSLSDGIKEARTSLNSGSALKTLKKLKKVSLKVQES